MTKDITIREVADFEYEWRQRIGVSGDLNAIRDSLKKFAGTAHQAKTICTQICVAIAKGTQGHKIFEIFELSDRMVIAMIASEEDQATVSGLIAKHVAKLKKRLP